MYSKLTRERVKYLLGWGLTNTDIALLLSMSPPTIGRCKIQLKKDFTKEIRDDWIKNNKLTITPRTYHRTCKYCKKIYLAYTKKGTVCYQCNPNLLIKVKPKDVLYIDVPTIEFKS